MLEAYKELVYEIFMQAFDDYKYLANNSIDKSVNRGTGEFSIKELKQFFKSKWCNYLLASLNIDINGADVFKLLEENKIQSI